MACETFPCMSYMALYVFSVHVLNTNSRASTHWKLDPDVNRVIQVSGAAADGAASGEPEVEITSSSSREQRIQYPDDINTSHGGGGGGSASAAAPPPPQPHISSLESVIDSTGERDAVLSVLTAQMKVDEDGVWVVRTKEVCTTCDKPLGMGHMKHETRKTATTANAGKQHSSNSDSNGSNTISKTNSIPSSKTSKANGKKSKSNGVNKSVAKSSSTTLTLDCGKTVNYTYLDHLPGIANRHNHPRIPEPEVGVVFNMKTMRAGELDIYQLEQTLKKQKKQKPKSANVYNQIGNLLRIKGETRKSIECYRKAIYLSPTDSEAILNLARVLFNLQYLDDAIYLVKRSLELQPIGDDTWLHYFTLGEILKAYGHYQDAILHFKHALDLNPDFQLAEIQLKELESWSESTVTVYTLLIIVFLVLTVLFFILSTVEANSDASDVLKPQRHFSRAMAMKSIKGHSGPRAGRVKKNHS